jgi:transcriptional regulator with XRE-family HTH domain
LQQIDTLSSRESADHHNTQRIGYAQVDCCYGAIVEMPNSRYSLTAQWRVGVLSVVRARPDKKKPRVVTAVDRAVGRQLSKRRRMLGMSQLELSRRLGITHRQVQKYEEGVNRISVSRLVQIAEVLDAPVAWFFADVDRGYMANHRQQGDAVVQRIARMPPRQAQATLIELWDWLQVAAAPRRHVRARHRPRSRKA